MGDTEKLTINDRMTEYLEGLKKQNQYSFGWDFDTFFSFINHQCNVIIASRGSNKEFKVTKDQKNLIKQLYLYSIGSDEFSGTLSKGIAIIGPIGTGKTLLLRSFLWLISSELTRKGEKKDLKWTTARYISERSGEKILDNWNNETTLTRYYSNGYLAIDDMGKEPLEVQNFGNHTKPISDIIAAKYDVGSRLFLTSNLTETELMDYYGASIYDRLKEMVNFFVLKGNSLRE